MLSLELECVVIKGLVERRTDFYQGRVGDSELSSIYFIITFVVRRSIEQKKYIFSRVRKLPPRKRQELGLDGSQNVWFNRVASATYIVDTLKDSYVLIMRDM